MKYVLSTILNVILWVAIVVLSFFVLNGVYQRYLSKNTYSGLFGFSYAVVVSGSMEPALHVNDMILFQKLDESEYEVGDIIVYVRGTGEDTILITHRIVSIDGGSLVTMGDANKGIPDPKIGFSSVVGRVVFRIPGIGHVVSVLRTRKGMTVSVALIAILVLLLVLISGIDRKKKTAANHETE